MNERKNYTLVAASVLTVIALAGYAALLFPLMSGEYRRYPDLFLVFLILFSALLPSLLALLLRVAGMLKNLWFFAGALLLLSAGTPLVSLWAWSNRYIPPGRGSQCGEWGLGCLVLGAHLIGWSLGVAALTFIFVLYRRHRARKS